MLFRAFRVIYTVKELDYHDQSFKKRFGSMTEYLCGNNLLPGSYKFWKVFSIMDLADINEGGTPYNNISPGRACRIDQSKSKCMPINALHLAPCAVFGCKGKITLFSFPKEPNIM